MDGWGLVDILRSSNLEGLDALVRDDVRFRSPYADYEGRADVCHVLRLIAVVLEDVRAVGEEHSEPRAGGVGPSGTRARVTQWTGTVRGAPVQGVFCADFDGSGRLSEAMLLLRPYRELRAAIQVMRGLLDESPLPSAGS